MFEPGTGLEVSSRASNAVCQCHHHQTYELAAEHQKQAAKTIDAHTLLVSLKLLWDLAESDKLPILKAIKECALLESFPKQNRQLGMVLVYDLVYGKGIQCGGQIKHIMMHHKQKLKLALANQDCAGPNEVILPKYARVNLLKSTVQNAVGMLQDMNYNLLSRENFLEHFRSCARQMQVLESKRSPSFHNVFCQDSHLNDVLMFCPFSSLTSTPLYADSKLILQDKASCFPAHLLAPSPGSFVIDACAAPGNKSTHLACLMNNLGTIVAFDKDKERYNTLIKMVEKSGATCVKAQYHDFLKVNPLDYSDATHILVDPSCSGSGIFGRVDYNSKKSDKGRLKSLCAFQKRVLKHAFLFPKVHRVVYSTCSLHYEENEEVVTDVLSCVGDTFDLIHCCKDWKRRGKLSFPIGPHCIRMNSEDLTNGFFVAVFERKLAENNTTQQLTDYIEIPKPSGIISNAPKKTKTKKRNYKHCPVTET